MVGLGRLLSICSACQQCIPRSRDKYAMSCVNYNLCVDAVKHCGKLRTNTKYRQEKHSALLAGIVPILELKSECSTLDIRTLLWSGSPSAIPTGSTPLSSATVTTNHIKTAIILEER